MKNQSVVVIVILVVFATAAIGYSLRSASPPFKSSDEAVPANMHRMPDGSMMNNANQDSGMHMMPDGSMMNNDGSVSNNTTGMDHSMMMMVKSEREFLEGMIPHHKEAVDTAKEVIARGGSTPEIKKLAQDIVVAQEKEIAMMKGWYQSWYGTAYVADPKAYKPMMRDLSMISGAALDKVFLEDMVVHHEGAIMMAKSVKPYIVHTEITELSKAIVDSQSREIEEMLTLLKSLQN